MSENFRGVVVLDDKLYRILSVDDSDCFAPGTRFVSLSLEEVVDYEER